MGMLLPSLSFRLGMGVWMLAMVVVVDAGRTWRSGAVVQASDAREK